MKMSKYLKKTATPSMIGKSKLTFQQIFVATSTSGFPNIFTNFFQPRNFSVEQTFCSAQAQI